jgi:UDP-2-acetamido-2-deoxy-ribo-hexuluronate aminotransferase
MQFTKKSRTEIDLLSNFVILHIDINYRMQKIQMVDLKGQFQEIKNEVLSGIERICESSSYINGQDVRDLAINLQNYTGSKYIIPCANGTDAIQVALMALDLKPGD